MQASNIRIDSYYNKPVYQLIEVLDSEDDIMMLSPLAQGDPGIIESMLLQIPPPALWFTTSQQAGTWKPITPSTELFVATIKTYVVGEEPLDRFRLLPEMNGQPLSSNRAFKQRIEETSVNVHCIADYLGHDLVNDLSLRVLEMHCSS